MIPVKTIIDRMRQVAIDAEGSERYLDSIDMIPAINSAIEWLVSIITPRLSIDKGVEEKMADLHSMRIWQTSRLSRIAFEENVGFNIWTITSVLVKPKVYVNMVQGSGLSAQYTFEVQSSNNKILDNAPIVSVAYNSNIPLKAHESTFRPELSFISCNNPATRLTVEELTNYTYDPFSPGFNHPGEIMNYGYSMGVDYTAENQDMTTYGGYTLTSPKEISIYPEKRIGRALVALSFIKYPKLIPATANTATTMIEMPDFMTNVIVQKSLNYIAMKEGDNTTIYNVSEKEVIQQLQ